MADQATERGWTPVPDPTKLTTDAVTAATDMYRRELNALRELLEARLSAMDRATELLASGLNHVPSETDKAVMALRELIEARIDAMDEATKLLATNVDKVPYAILQEAGNLKAFIMSKIEDVSHVTDARFAAVEDHFEANKLALGAALSAQKEAAAEQNKSNTLAISKSEQATKETIASNAATTASQFALILGTIADLKDRLVRLEAGGVAVKSERSEQRDVRADVRGARDGLNQMVVLAIMGVSVLVAIASLIAFAVKK